VSFVTLAANTLPSSPANAVNLAQAEESPWRLIGLAEVMTRSGYRRTTVYKLIGLGAFPKPVKPGLGDSSRWVLGEVKAFVEAAIAARDATPRPPAEPATEQPSTKRIARRKSAPASLELA
jgi:predicted DNA-binding transcriptional regulator AlpA